LDSGEECEIPKAADEGVGRPSGIDKNGHNELCPYVVIHNVYINMAVIYDCRFKESKPQGF
jgi:hypothetical protein